MLSCKEFMINANNYLNGMAVRVRIEHVLQDVSHLCMPPLNDELISHATNGNFKKILLLTEYYSVNSFAITNIII